MTALLFDLDGVVMRPRTDSDRLRIERAAGATDPEAFWDVYKELRPAYEAGDVSDYRWWQQVGLRAGLDDPDIAEAIVADWESATVVNDEIVEILEKLREADYTCGIVANVTETIGDKLRSKYAWIDALDAVIFSCDIGITQPDPRAYEVAVDALGANLKDTIYFTANPDHLASAREAGLQARPFTSIKDVHDLQL
ncbi:HAD family hydrolase [Corynebacterium lubricantis]|uniref:HAD family hydrolase n=1 Tax=Corynebacterium lubricantis TaxID=541095 RepID=UPI00036687EF|nr:HAD family hydrolase [Corynebacterium lubricantis]